jgi:hypothetical protein
LEEGVKGWVMGDRKGYIYPVKKGSVAFLDLLGFKGLWKKENPSTLIDKIIKIQGYSDSKLQEWNETVKVFNNMLKFKIFYFSDTFIITVEENSKNTSDGDKTSSSDETVGIDSVRFNMVLTGNLFNEALKHGLLLRGAISYGDFYHISDRNMILGPAVDEVADWYETSDWAGIHLTPSGLYRYSFENYDYYDELEGNEPLCDSVAVAYPIPLKGKDGKQNTILSIAVNWVNLKYLPLQWKADEMFDKTTEYEKSLYKHFSEQPIGPINPSVYRKYENTIRFIKYIVKRNLENIESPGDEK